MKKCWAFMIPYDDHALEPHLIAKMDKLVASGRARCREYTCEGTPDQCRHNPNGDYYMLVGSRRQIPTIAKMVAEYCPNERPWGIMGSFFDEFPHEKLDRPGAGRA